MALNVWQPFKRTSKGQRFDWDVMTKAQMLAWDDTQFEDWYLVVEKDSHDLYIYDSNATPSQETWKFVKSSWSGGYVLPTASTSTLGGVKVGDNLNIDQDGVLSVDKNALPMTTDLLWELPSGSIVNPDTITLLNPTTDYDQILVVGYVHSNGKDHLMTSLLLPENLTTTNDIGLSDQEMRYIWYDVTSTTQLTKRIGDGGLLMFRIYGIRFGSSLDGTIGRWEKIGQWETDQTGLIIDLSKYNMVTLTGIFNKGSNNPHAINSVTLNINDIQTTGQLSLRSLPNPDTIATLTNTATNTWNLILTGTCQGAILYGYKETAISDADVQKIADATALKSTNMEALWNNWELKGMKLFQNDKDLRLFDDGQILIIDDTTTKSVNLAKIDYVDSKSPTIVNEWATFTNAQWNQKMQIRTGGTNSVIIKDTNANWTAEYWSYELPDKPYVDTELAKKWNAITTFDNEYKTLQIRDVNDSVEFQVVKETSNDYVRVNEYAEDDRWAMQQIFDVKLPTKEYVDSKGGWVNMEVWAEKLYWTYTQDWVTYQVYSKIVYIPALPSTAGITTYPMGVSNIKQILNIYWYTTDGFILNAPRQNVQDNISIYQVSKGSQTFSIEVWKDRSSKSAYVTIIYAKNN